MKRNYEFNLSEHEEISVLTGEIAEMICQSERISLTNDMEGLVLCDLTANKVLGGNMSLSDYGIKNGAKLMLL
ncbi:MAG: hypothetical protein Q4C01_04420 [Clostridia bacterium]|nr:hypothetical protein [Clostridia bacterium]